MKTMQDFAAQQLSKRQMNRVKGGAMHSANCVTTNPQGVVVNTFTVQYEDGAEYLLQRTVEQFTPIGCITKCYA